MTTMTRALALLAAPLMLSMPVAAMAQTAAASTPAAAAASATAAAMPEQAPSEGILRLKSAHGFDETLVRLKADVAAKEIRLFDVIDQAALGAQVNLPVNRSTLVLFGNPPLGVQFLTANPYAGLDWPVRMLVTEEADHTVYVAWTDFGTIAARHRITTRDAQFKMASAVAASIATAASGQ